MHLYLSSGKSFSETFPDIHLVDGHVPGIGPITPDLQPGEMFPCMEPAGWFKVLVLDSVTIDCERRVVHWTSNVNVNAVLEADSAAKGEGANENSNAHRKRISESMYVGGDYDETQGQIDDLFKAAQKVIKLYQIPDNQRHPYVQTFPQTVFKKLFTLLHCYVLPIIRLTTDDSEELMKAVAKQEELIDFSNREISQKCSAAEKLEASMKNQRRSNYYPELIKPSKSVSYPAEFIEILSKGVHSDIQEIWHKVEVEVENIQALKAELLRAESLKAESPRAESLQAESPKAESDAESNSSSSSDGRDSNAELADLKKRRDDLLKTHEEYIHVRESLHALMKGSSVMENPPPEIWHKKNPKQKKKESKKIKKVSSKVLNPLHAIYIKMYEQFQELQNETQVLMLRKVRQASVREAIINILKELKESDESFGMDLDVTGSHRPTDIIQNSQVPKRWQTLTEKVANAITNGGTVKQLFQDYVSHFLIQCQGLITEHDRALRAVPINSSEKTVEGGGLPDPMFCPPNPPNPSNPQKTVPIVGPSKGASCFPQSIINSQEIYRQSQPNVDSLAASDSHSASDSHAVSDSASRQSTDDYMFVFDQEQDYMEKGKDTLFKGIKAHFQEMVEVLLTQLKLSKNDANRQRMRLCYESHFYEAVMPSLVHVCNIAGAGSLKIIQDWLPMLTVQDFDISNPVLLSLLVPTEITPTHHESASVSNSSGESSSREEDTDPKDESEESRGELECSVGGAVGYSNGSGVPKIVEESQGELEGAVGYTNSSKHDPPPSGTVSGWILRETDRLRTDPTARDRQSHRVCSVFDDSETQDKDADDVFPIVQDSPHPNPDPHTHQLEKSDQSEYFTCEDDSHSGDPSPSHNNILRQAATGAKVDGEGVLERSETCPLYNDDKDKSLRFSEDPLAGPRLQMLASAIDFSDSSSMCSDSSGGDGGDIFPESETNKRLLREAEDVLAGVRTMQQKGEAEFQDAFHRTISVSDVNVVTPEILTSDIEIHAPDSVTVVFNNRRMSKDVSHGHVSQGGSIGKGSDVSELDRESVRASRVSNSQLLVYSSVRFHPEVAKQFQPVFECLSCIITATAPLHKLQGFRACLNLLNGIFKKLHEEGGKKCFGACNEVFIDITILALCNYDPVLTACLYTQMHIIRAMLTKDMEDGSFGYALTVFESALTFIQQKILLKQNLAENAQAKMNCS